MISGAFTAQWAADLVGGYVDDVMSGRRVACRHERYGVERYLDDLEHAAARGYRFDKKQATFAVRFFPLVLKHAVGEWNQEPFAPSGWQAFCIWNIQGWRKIDDGTRRFRKAYVTVARKNGKTTWASGMVALIAYADSPLEAGGRAYLAATKRPQALLTFEPLVEMVEQSADLSKVSTTYRSPPRIEIELNLRGVKYKSRVETIGADSKRQDGLNPSLVCKDEIHEWGETLRPLHEKLSTGGASRRQALELITTTAGSDDAPIWEEVHDSAERVVEAAAAGDHHNDALFAYIAQLDEEDEPLDPAVWQKANPNWAVSVKPEYIEQAAAEATLQPALFPQFVRYHCNRRTASFIQAYPSHLWELGNERLDPPPQKGDLCFGGMDLSLGDDWSAVSFVFPRFDEASEQWTYGVESKVWACRGQRLPYDRSPFREWIADGLLEVQHNEILDHTPLKHHILAYHRRYQLRQFNYDKRFAHEIAADLYNNFNLECLDWFQTHKNYNEPILSFEAALKDGRIYHGNDPVLTWQARNAELEPKPGPDGRDLFILKKGGGRRYKKIDAVAAMLMAYDGALFHCERKKASLSFDTTPAR